MGNEQRSIEAETITKNMLEEYLTKFDENGIEVEVNSAGLMVKDAYDYVGEARTWTREDTLDPNKSPYGEYGPLYGLQERYDKSLDYYNKLKDGGLEEILSVSSKKITQCPDGVPQDILDYNGMIKAKYILDNYHRLDGKLSSGDMHWLYFNGWTYQGNENTRGALERDLLLSEDGYEVRKNYKPTYIGERDFDKDEQVIVVLIEEGKDSNTRKKNIEKVTKAYSGKVDNLQIITASDLLGDKIPDPIYGGIEGHREVYNNIKELSKRTVEGLVTSVSRAAMERENNPEQYGGSSAQT